MQFTDNTATILIAVRLLSITLHELRFIQYSSTQMALEWHKSQFEHTLLLQVNSNLRSTGAKQLQLYGTTCSISIQMLLDFSIYVLVSIGMFVWFRWLCNVGITKMRSN